MNAATESRIRQPPESPVAPGVQASGERAPAGGDRFRAPARQGAYAALTVLHGAALGAFIAWRKRSGRDLPERIGLADVALVGLATQRTSRAIAKDKVTAPFRAPVTAHESEDEAGPGEVDETPRGGGLRYVVGELILCPFCLAQWVAAGFFAGLVAAPRVTRFFASLMASVGLADFLQTGFRAAEERIER
jgi:hypothetical protein